MAAPIPKESSKGKGPIGQKRAVPKPKEEATLAPCLQVSRTPVAVDGFLDQSASKFARLINFKTLTSGAKFAIGSRPIRFRK